MGSRKSSIQINCIVSVQTKTVDILTSWFGGTLRQCFLDIEILEQELGVAVLGGRLGPCWPIGPMSFLRMV